LGNWVSRVHEYAMKMEVRVKEARRAQGYLRSTRRTTIINEEVRF
jgi:hypothetical protein